MFTATLLPDEYMMTRSSIHSRPTRQCHPLRFERDSLAAPMTAPDDYERTCSKHGCDLKPFEAASQHKTKD